MGLGRCNLQLSSHHRNVLFAADVERPWMKSFVYYRDWLQEDPENRMVVVPGIHMVNALVKLWNLESEQVIDMYSIAHYAYPEYEGKTLAFYNYTTCIGDMLDTKYDIVDLEGCLNE